VDEDQKQSSKRAVKYNGGTLYPFQPGQTGNPNGRPRTRPITDALKKFLAEEQVEIRVGGKPIKISAIDALVRVGVTQALKGDPRFYKEIMDRSDGKVQELLDVTSGGAPLLPGLTQEQLARAFGPDEGPDEE